MLSVHFLGVAVLVLCAGASLGSSTPAPVAISAPDPPAERVPQLQGGVELSLMDEGIDDQGKWFQVLQLTIKEGGTLAEAARVIYGDEARAMDLFRVVRARHPEIVDPQRVPVGLKLIVRVDPAVTFSLKETVKLGDTEERRYFNGARELRRGTVRVVEFPTDKPGKEFVLPGDGEELRFMAGAKFLEYQYHSPDRFEQVVAALYGTPSVKAMTHFIGQTGWDANRWPPPPAERLRAVLAPGTDLADEPIVALSLSSGDPTTEGRFQKLVEERAQAGIWPIKQDSFGITYRVRVSDPNVSAKGVARLLYGSERRFAELASRAGVQVSREATPSDFLLLGREFELYVESQEELFPAGEPQVDQATGSVTTRLLNGTVVAKAARGLNQVIDYPGGYRKIVHEPAEVILLLARTWSLAFGQDQEAMARAAWQIDPTLPRRPGEVVQRAELATEANRAVLRVILVVREDAGFLPWLFRQWMPCLVVVGLVVVATFLVLLLGQTRRRRGIRWTSGGARRP